MKLIEKQKAILLRKNGRSIKEITRLVGASKASVSIWVRDIVLTQNQKILLKKKGFTTDVIEKRRASRLKNEHIKKNLIIDEAKKDFSKISPRDLKLIGAMLYWAEGGKTRSNMVRIANSDPEMILVIMDFLEKFAVCRKKNFGGIYIRIRQKMLRNPKNFGLVFPGFQEVSSLRRTQNQAWQAKIKGILCHTEPLIYMCAIPSYF